MIQYFVWILILLVVYGIIINKVDSGRCFRYEYIIRTLVIIGLEIICFLLIISNILPLLSLLCSIIILILMYFNLKYTIQRLYDLNLSGWYILLKLIPVFSIFVTLYLYFKKGDININDYDKAINYKSFFKNKHFIDIYENKFIVDDEEYQYEQYLKKYQIKISKYRKENYFSKYLLENFPVEQYQIYKIIEFSEDKLKEIINALNLIVIEQSFYINFRNYRFFIRHEDFKYTIILNKNDNKITKELFDVFDFPGSFYEDEDNIYYNKIYKEELLKWANNVA